MIIKCRRLFDGLNLYENKILIIRDQRIAAVLDEREPFEAEGGGAQEVIECPFAMPGLIDSKARIFGYHERSPEGAPFEPHEMYLQLLLYSGVTSIRDTGNSLETMLYLKHKEQKELTPHVFSSGPMLDDAPLTWAFSRIAQNREEVREIVRRLADEGAHFLYAYRNLKPIVLEEVVRIAKEHRLKTSVNLGKTRARQACEAGADSFDNIIQMLEPSWVPGVDVFRYSGGVGLARLWAHVDLISAPVRELAERMAQKGVFLSPCYLAARRRVDLDEAINEPYLDYMVAIMPYHRHLKSMRNPFGYAIGKKYLSQYMAVPSLSKSERQELENGFQKMGELLKLLHEYGVKLVVGSDSPTQSVVPGFGLIQEMRHWVQIGIPPLEVLRAATSRAAELLGVDDVGRVKVGAWADLLLLQKDPVENINHLISPDHQVICRGIRVNRAGIKAKIVERIQQE